jgi:hypothetical protein
MKFVMNRSRVVTGFGHSVEFVKGEPTHVPPELYREVLAVGGAPEGEVDTDPVKPTAPGEPGDPLAREAALFEAFETLALANKRGSFTAGGTPHPKALKDLLGWDAPTAERDAAWTKFVQGKGE